MDPVPFLNIPTEITWQIGDQLSTKDLGKLRLTCRQVDEAVLAKFATEFFKIRWVFLFPESLESLIQISQHPYFSQTVRELKICLAWIQSCSYAPYKDGLTAQKYQWIYVTKGTWMQDLSKALSNLPNCSTVQIRDFSSFGRRPREGTRYNGYGIKTLQDHPHVRAAFGGNPPSWVQGLPIVPNVIQVLAESNFSSDPTSLVQIGPSAGASLPMGATSSTGAQSPAELGLAAHSSSYVLKDLSIITSQTTNTTKPNNWNAPIFNSPKISRLESLTQLMICCSTPTKDWNSIRPFFQALVNLRVLRLNSDELRLDRFPTSHDLAAVGSTLFQIIADVFGQGNIQSFQLGKVNIPESQLRIVLQAMSKTLKELVLYRVFLAPADPSLPGWQQVLADTKQFDNLHKIVFRLCFESSTQVVWKPSPQTPELWQYDQEQWPADIEFSNASGRRLESWNIDELSGRLVCMDLDFWQRLERFHRDSRPDGMVTESEGDDDEPGDDEV